MQKLYTKNPISVNSLPADVCVNKFSVKPSLPYSYSEIGSKIFYRCFDGDDVGVSPQANPSRPPKGEKSSYTRTDLHLTLPPGGQTRSSLAGGSQPIALPYRSKAAATDQEAGHYRPRAPPQERQHPMLSRRLLLGLPSRLPENRCILVQSTSKAGGQVRPAGAGSRACPVVGHEVLKGPNTLADVRVHHSGV